LTESRSVKAVGIDTASIDFGQSSSFDTYRLLFDRNVPAFENITAFDRLPLLGAVVIALPMKIKGGSGAPLRAVAVIPR
jgi:kynurenine formamidase